MRLHRRYGRTEILGGLSTLALLGGVSASQQSPKPLACRAEHLEQFTQNDDCGYVMCQTNLAPRNLVVSIENAPVRVEPITLHIMDVQPMCSDSGAGKPSKFSQDEPSSFESRLAKFFQTASSLDLQNAVDLLRQESFIKPGEREPQPDNATAHHWLQTFGAIDAIESKLMAHLKVPVTLVAPPPSPDGTPSPYPPGVPIDTVTDPAIREKYRKAILRNKEVADRNNNLYRIRAIDTTISAQFVVWAHPRYLHRPSEQSALLKEAREQKLTVQRISQIMLACGREE